jgi:hypothetical protein
MPKVGNKKYSYTAAMKKDAQVAMKMAAMKNAARGGSSGHPRQNLRIPNGTTLAPGVEKKAASAAMKKSAMRNAAMKKMKK